MRRSFAAAFRFPPVRFSASSTRAVSNFSTQGAGHYQVNAYQALRNKSSLVSTMSFDLS